MYLVTLARAGVQGQRSPTLVKVEMKMSTDAGCRGLMETEADIRVLCQRFATRSPVLTLRSDLSDQVRLPDLCKFIPIKEVRRSVKRSDFSVSDWWKQRKIHFLSEN